MEIIAESAYLLATLIPGFAVLLRFFPDDADRGLLPSAAFAYLITVALFTPIVALAFLFTLSTQLVSYIFGLFVTLAIFDVLFIQRANVKQVFLKRYEWPEVMLVLGMAVIIHIGGGELFADHSIHGGKLLFLKHFGFSLQDPYSPIAVIEPRHHVSTYHGLHAIGCYLTNAAPVKWWYNSTWFFFLLSLGGIQFLAHRFFNSDWVSICTAIGAILPVITCKLSDLPIPNAVAMWVFVPILISHLIEVNNKPSHQSYLKIALAVIAISAVHVGLWVIVVICLAPTVILCGIISQFQKKNLVPYLAVLLLFTLGFPFALLSAIQPVNDSIVNQAGQPWSMIRLNIAGLSMHMMNPRIYLALIPTIPAGLTLLIARGYRKDDTLIVYIVATSAFIMFFPPAFEILKHIIPHWMIKRAVLFIILISIITICGGISWLVSSKINRRTTQFLFAITILCSGIIIFRPEIKEYIADRELHQKLYHRSEDLRQALNHNDVDRPLIAANQDMSNIIPASIPSAVMATTDGTMNPTDPEIIKRRDAARELLDAKTNQKRRVEIIRNYGIDYILLDGPKEQKALKNKYDAFAELYAEGEWFQILKINKSAR